MLSVVPQELGDRPAPVAPLLQVDRATLQYKTRDHVVTATYKVSFEVFAGDRYILLGPSGCGKSTLLKAIGGFLPPVEGEIRLGGRKITRPGADRMMVFQEFDQLPPWLTVIENVMFPMRKTGRFPVAELRDRARSVIEKVGLSRFENAYPHTLSGGMKQRVAIARALAMEPAVLLMDEPFAALDALTRQRMQQELLALWDDIGFTLLFVTHSIEEAILLGNRILVLTPHPGQVRAELDAEAYGFDLRGSADFNGLQRRISHMLFGEKVQGVSHE
ncbi:ABC transporter ATP-binding protein [Ancylobacter sp. VNQ12]|uniref:ABC transporter ATP-binding protein n=1 Tax=Ancylobacter sp. VNQ12 TaxID=3400920 RepID=UPI003C0B8615